MKIVHFARYRVDGQEQMRLYPSLCGLPDATEHFWTINKEHVTCVFCYARLPAGGQGKAERP